MNKFKNFFIIISFLAVVILLVYGIYYFFFSPPDAGTPIGRQPGPLEPGQLPDIGPGGNLNQQINGNVNAGLPSIDRVPTTEKIADSANGGYTKVNPVSDYRVNNPVLSTSGNLNYYDPAEGRFYKINKDGSVTRLSDQRFFSVDNITWSKEGDKAVLEYPDGSNIVYDFNQDKQYSLPREFQDFDFAKSGSSLAAEVIGPRDENNWIVTSNIDGSGIQFIERIAGEADNVDINISPNNQTVATFRNNINSNTQEVIFIGRNQENFKSLTVYGRGFEGSWTPDGNRLLYSVHDADNGFLPGLWLTDASGNQIGLNNRSLGLNTWPDKCAMNSDGTKAYCGVPNHLPVGSGLYRELANDSYDNFYEIDLVTGQSSLLALPVGDQAGYSVRSIFLSEADNRLYYQDEYSGRLFSLDIE